MWWRNWINNFLTVDTLENPKSDLCQLVIEPLQRVKVHKSYLSMLLPPVINGSRLCHNIWFEEKAKPCIYCQTSRTYLHYNASSPHWTSSLRLKVVRAEGEKMAFHCSVNLVASLILAGLSSAVFTMRMRPLGLGRGESRSEDESVSLIMVDTATCYAH